MNSFKLKPEQEDSIIFLVGLLLATAPLITPLGVPIAISPMTTEYYNLIEGLEEGSRVYVEIYSGIRDWFDSGQATVATLKHLTMRIKAGEIRGVVIGSLGVEGPVVLPQSIKIIATANLWEELEYGEQFVWLGWNPGFETAMASMLVDFKGTIPTDKFGTPIDELPLLDGITTIEDFEMIVVSFYGSAEIYARQWSGRKPIYLANCWVGHMTGLMPLYPDQIQGFMTHVRQTAEYEKLLGYKGLGMALTESQLLIQFYLIGVIITGTVIYWVRRSR